MTRRGRFLSFEGLDGCGKTTQLNLLTGFLEQRGIEVVTAREPGGTAVGERIRALLLDSRTQGLSPIAELGLMFSSRAQLIAEFIEPSLAAGKWVICDRYSDSSVAYQGGGRGLGIDKVLAVHQALCGSLWPELTVLMDAGIAPSVERARRRNEESTQIEGHSDENRFEQENREFFERVHEAYMAIARREPERVLVIDARHSIREVHAAIRTAVTRRFPELLQPAGGSEAAVHGI
jgi:dTMP kinase